MLLFEFKPCRAPEAAVAAQPRAMGRNRCLTARFRMRCSLSGAAARRLLNDQGWRLLQCEGRFAGAPAVHL